MRLSLATFLIVVGHTTGTGHNCSTSLSPVLGASLSSSAASDLWPKRCGLRCLTSVHLACSKLTEQQRARNTKARDNLQSLLPCYIAHGIVRFLKCIESVMLLAFTLGHRWFNPDKDGKVDKLSREDGLTNVQIRKHACFVLT
jgi:hypothetical protein